MAVNKLIEKYGKNAKQNGQPAFEQTQMEQELSALFDQIKNFVWTFSHLSVIKRMLQYTHVQT